MSNNLNEVARQTRAAFAEQEREQRQRDEEARARHRQAEAKRIADDRHARAATIEAFRANPATA